jgi:filamentous haemagglutinin family N-terminal domain
MKGCYLEKWFKVSSVLIALFSSDLCAAQVVGDTTLPTEERSQVTGNPNFQIDGGARRDGNLFHSFQSFSVPTGGSAFFNNAVDVQNIFSRVTGGSISNIDGVIRANGTANLFLLNPNGILFGARARLNIGGSFVASTANSINFADNFQYSATNPQTTPLLTVRVPVGLQMGTNPGSIVVQGNGYDLSIQVPIFSPIIRGASSTGLRVSPGKTLALVGGDVDIVGGTRSLA